MNTVPTITFELALLKLDDLARDRNFDGLGHRSIKRTAGFRELVGAYLVAFGRWIGGPSVVAPAAESRW
jgi:hypothetical protein